MRHLRLTGLILLGSGFLVFAAEPDEIRLPVPKEWKGETIKLPPGFARDMSLKGTEYIRFAPGMFDPASDSFFSYVFVFRLEQKPELKPEIIKQEFLKYYRGLCVAVLGDKASTVDTKKFTFKFEPKKDKKKDAKSEKSKITELKAELSWVEPFATKKSQKLLIEIHTWAEKNHNLMFVCVSPKAKDKPIWKQMREIRAKFHKEHRAQ